VAGEDVCADEDAGGVVPALSAQSAKGLALGGFRGRRVGESSAISMVTSSMMAFDGGVGGLCSASLLVSFEALLRPIEAKRAARLVEGCLERDASSFLFPPSSTVEDMLALLDVSNGTHVREKTSCKEREKGRKIFLP